MKTNLPIYLQVYSVRDAFQEDWRATFKRIAEIGYQGVELFKLPDGVSAADTAAVLKEVGLGVSALMVKLDELEKNFAANRADIRALGADTLTVPWIQDPGNAAGWQDIARRLEVMGKKLRGEGAYLQYHNHAFEFNVYDGKCAMEWLAEGTTAENLRFEVDTCWVQHGGQNPAEFIAKYKDRICHLHLKDKYEGSDIKFAEVGSGILDWAGILSEAAKADVKYVVVEQDTCPGDPFDSIAQSIKYLRS